MEEKIFAYREFCQDAIYDRAKPSSHLFGTKEHFGIEVTYDIDIIVNAEIIEKFACYEYMWGQVKFWVKGKNLFSYNIPDEDATYWHEFNPLVECFTTDLAEHIKGEPFPLETKSKYACEMYIETSIIDTGESYLEKFCELTDEEKDVEQIKGDWFGVRCLKGYAQGSFMPSIYFQRVNDKIEISWNIREPFKASWGEFWPTYKKGIEHVDVEVYKTVILEFCQSYCDKFKRKYPDIIKEHQDRLDILLQKLR